MVFFPLGVREGCFLSGPRVLLKGLGFLFLWGVRSLWVGLKLALKHLWRAFRRRPPTVYQGVLTASGRVTLPYPHEKASVPENGHCTAPVCEGSYPASLRKKASFCIKLCSPIFGQDPHHLPQGFLRVYRGVGRDLLDAKEILVEVIPLSCLSRSSILSLGGGFSTRYPSRLPRRALPPYGAGYKSKSSLENK
jgi:hypothetical protein